MAYSIKLSVLGMELQFAAADQKDLWRQVSLFQALPDTCPIDGTPARLNYRYVDENDFFEVVNSGPTLFKFPLGQYKKGGDLFPKNMWVLWDGERKEEIVLWENGRLTAAGERCRIDSQRRQPRQQPGAAIGQPAPEAIQSAVAPRQAPTATFTPPTPEAQQPAPVLSVKGQAGAVELNPFADPNAGAHAEAREPLVIAIHKLGKAIYGRNVNEELLKMAGNITGREIAGLMQLDYAELRKLDAIVKLDQTGLKRHRKLVDWYKELHDLLPAGATIYRLSASEIDRIHAGLPIAG